MRKYLIFICILFLFASNIKGQTPDTIYWDKNYKECNKAKAYVYGFEEYDNDSSGVIKYYFMNNQLHSLKKYKNGKKNGVSKWWYINGQIKCKGKYKKGLENGQFIYFYSNGVRKEKGKYKEGKRIGIWYEWDTKGKLISDY